MIRNNYGLPALMFAVSLLIGHASAGVTDNTSRPVVDSQPAAQQTEFSPRNYCRSTGGAVNETRQAHIYLCCYPGKPQCMVTDTKQAISWRASASVAKSH